MWLVLVKITNFTISEAQGRLGGTAAPGWAGGQGVALASGSSQGLGISGFSVTTSSSQSPLQAPGLKAVDHLFFHFI